MLLSLLSTGAAPGVSAGTGSLAALSAPAEDLIARLTKGTDVIVIHSKGFPSHGKVDEAYNGGEFVKVLYDGYKDASDVPVQDVKLKSEFEEISGRSKRKRPKTDMYGFSNKETKKGKA